MANSLVSLAVRLRVSRSLVPIVLCTVAGCSTPGQLTSPADADQDFVPAPNDLCEESLVSNPVDDRGCELFTGTLANVDFEPGEHALNTAAREALDAVIEDMKRYKTVVLAIGGHTDNRGSARDNLALSKKRVMSVVRYLVVNGIDGRRLRPHGYGESRPIASNATEEGRRINRRIELNIVKPSS